MRTLCASVLFFEAVMVGVAVPAGLALSHSHHGLILWGGLALALACVVVAGLLRHPFGYVLGSALQLVVLASGFLLPAMFFLGLLFGGLWVLAIVLARKVDRYARLRALAPDHLEAPDQPEPPDQPLTT
jgi:hypothetical protein